MNFFVKKFWETIFREIPKFFKIFFGQKSDAHHGLKKLSPNKIHEVLAPLGIAVTRCCAKLQKPFIHKGFLNVHLGKPLQVLGFIKFESDHRETLRSHSSIHFLNIDECVAENLVCSFEC